MAFILCNIYCLSHGIYNDADIAKSLVKNGFKILDESQINSKPINMKILIENYYRNQANSYSKFSFDIFINNGITILNSEKFIYANDDSSIYYIDLVEKEINISSYRTINKKDDILFFRGKAIDSILNHSTLIRFDTVAGKDGFQDTILIEIQADSNLAYPTAGSFRTYVIGCKYGGLISTIIEYRKPYKIMKSVYRIAEFKIIDQDIPQLNDLKNLIYDESGTLKNEYTDYVINDIRNESRIK